jgi:hypothetical protein
VLCGHFGDRRVNGTSTCTGEVSFSERIEHGQGLASTRPRTRHSSEGMGAGRERTNAQLTENLFFGASGKLEGSSGF